MVLQGSPDVVALSHRRLSFCQPMMIELTASALSPLIKMDHWGGAEILLRGLVLRLFAVLKRGAPLAQTLGAIAQGAGRIFGMSRAPRTAPFRAVLRGRFGSTPAVGAPKAEPGFRAESTSDTTLALWRIAQVADGLARAM